MSKNITLMGASYTAVPAVQLPQTGGGTALFTDVSDTTAVAADVASGKYFYLATGEKVEGSGSGGGGGVTRENIVPQQTITATVGYNGLTSTAVLIEGADYEYTVNGETRLGTAVDVNGTLQLGDGDYYWYEQGGCFVTDGSVMYFRTSAAGSYTVKVDKITLSGGGGGGSTLIEKTITANGTYNASDDSADGYSSVTVNVSGGSVNIGTVTTTNSSNQNTSIEFTLPSGRTPKAFFCRLTSQIARSSNSRYYYVYDMRWDGSSNGGVEGNTFYMYSGTLTNVTSGYSKSQSGTTFTLSSTGTRSTSPGSFFNGTYELVYVY